MKTKIWLIQIPMIAIFSLAFLIIHLGEVGDLKNKFLRQELFPSLRNISGITTNLKFQIRGTEKPKNKIVILEIDESSVEDPRPDDPQDPGGFGRWPWGREFTAKVLETVLSYGPKVVGLDIVFAEKQERVPQEIVNFLTQTNRTDLIGKYNSDNNLSNIFYMYPDKLVLGWFHESPCQPVYRGSDCPIDQPEIKKSLEDSQFWKFGFSQTEIHPKANLIQSPIIFPETIVKNIDLLNAPAEHAGTFQATPDPDNFIRRISLGVMLQKKMFPSLALEVARVGLQEELKATLDESARVESIEFLKSKRKISVSPQGVMEINFRGPAKTFTYVTVKELMGNSETVYLWFGEANKTLKDVHFDCPSCKEGKTEDGITYVTAKKTDIFKDAYVLVGPTALGIFDMRAFPFDENAPGVEGHATILDNLLSGDPLRSASTERTIWPFLLVMSLGMLLFAFLIERLEALPGLFLLGAIFAAFSYFDLIFLFKQRNFNLNSGWVYLELLTIFMIHTAIKYVMEERNKKFLKSAFSKYVSPAMVDSILKDPTKLKLGGEKKDLTILFSDIRSFTTLSEKMEPKILAQFLNDYLGKMTNIAFINRGTLDKYIGDAVMAFWNAPLDVPDHAYQAVKAAIEMQQKLDIDRPIYRQKYDIDVKVGVGINTGPVSVGNMGSDDNFNYTVIGDDVNLASRLEGITKEYGISICVSRATLKAIEESGHPTPPHRVLDQVVVKGKKQAVEIIEILHAEKDAKGLALFEQARQLYMKRQWDQALSLLDEANQLLKPSPEQHDGPCERLIEVCLQFKQNPPSADWDGSWEMTSK